jgi:HEAT repeat protein
MRQLLSLSILAIFALTTSLVLAEKPVANTPTNKEKTPASQAADTKTKSDETQTKIDALIALLKNQKTSLMDKVNAIGELTRFAEKASAALPILFQLIQSKEIPLREASTFGLAAIGPDHPQTLPALIKALTDEMPQVRQCAASALGNLGTKAAKAVPSLLKALEHKDENLHLIIAWSLGNIEDSSENVIKALFQLHKSPNPRIQKSAYASLHRLLKRNPFPDKDKKTKDAAPKATTKDAPKTETKDAAPKTETKEATKKDILAPPSK